MANLKLDLVNKLNNDKFYAELELVRLAQEPKTNYKEKIKVMKKLLKEIAIVNIQLGLTEQYFQEPTADQGAPAPTEQPVKKRPSLAQGQGQAPANGQSHQE